MQNVVEWSEDEEDEEKNYSSTHLAQYSESFVGIFLKYPRTA
jgi:hypothetical protein